MTGNSQFVCAANVAQAEKYIRSTQVLLDKATEIGVLILKQELRIDALNTNAENQSRAVSSEDKATLLKEKAQVESVLDEEGVTLDRLIFEAALEAFLEGLPPGELELLGVVTSK